MAAALEISLDKVITVAGNHDVDWKPVHQHPSFNHIIKSLDNSIPTNEQNLCNEFWNKNYIIKEFDDIIIFAYNSVYNFTDESRSKETDINNETLDLLRIDLEKLEHINKPKIAISHHHPSKFSNFDLEYKDGDSIENGDNLLDLLSEFNFSLFLHGHKHIPRLEYKNDLPVFCSGSFSSLENIKDFSIKNMFHIVELIDKNSSKYYGHIETFEFILGRGWKKNTDTEGFFPSNTGFGFIGDIKDLANQVIQWFTGKGKDMVSYNNLVADFEQILYLTPFQLSMFEKTLLQEGKIKIIPSLFVTPEFITKQIEQ